MDNFDLKKYLAEGKLLKESLRLPDLLEDETIKNNLTSKSGYLMNTVVTEVKKDQWYVYGQVDSSTPFWEKLEYSDNPEENREIIFEQDIIEGSDRYKISKYINSILKKQGIPVVRTYLGEV